MLYADSLLRAADLAEVLLRDDLRDRYTRQATDVRGLVNRTFWDTEVGAYVDGDLRDHHPLDANALAVRFGIADGDRATRALSFIRDRLWTPVGSVTSDVGYGSWAHDGTIWPAYVYSELEARFSTGDDQGALEALRRTWGSMLANDPASTFWEFGTRDGAIHDGSVSLAHGWSTGALPALSRWVLGVRPLKPGYAEYTLDPHPGDLDWACGAVPGPAGLIRVAWQRTDTGLTLWVDAPAGTLGRVAASDGSVTTVGPGRQSLEVALARR
jgi:glycogen debranching enzyme